MDIFLKIVSKNEKQKKKWKSGKKKLFHVQHEAAAFPERHKVSFIPFLRH